MHIAPFGVEIWMNAWENHCTHNLAETCVETSPSPNFCASPARTPMHSTRYCR